MTRHSQSRQAVITQNGGRWAVVKGGRGGTHVGSHLLALLARPAQQQRRKQVRASLSRPCLLAFVWVFVVWRWLFAIGHQASPFSPQRPKRPPTTTTESHAFSHTSFPQLRQPACASGSSSAFCITCCFAFLGARSLLSSSLSLSCVLLSASEASSFTDKTKTTSTPPLTLGQSPYPRPATRPRDILRLLRLKFRIPTYVLPPLFRAKPNDGKRPLLEDPP